MPSALDGIRLNEVSAEWLSLQLDSLTRWRDMPGVTSGELAIIAHDESMLRAEVTRRAQRGAA